jgi:ribonuclease-3
VSDNCVKPSVLGADGFLFDSKLLDLSLTHRSWAYEHGGVDHNERLEFLGDSVLGFAVTGLLYKRFPPI